MADSREDIGNLLSLIEQFTEGRYDQAATTVDDADSPVAAKLKELGARLIEADLSRKLVQEELLGSQEQLQMIVDNIDEVVYAIDFPDGDYKSGTITYLSPQVKKVLGYTIEEFKKDTDLWFSLIHPEDVTSVVEDTRKVVETGKGVTRSYRLKHKKTKEYVWFEDKVLPKLDNKGEVCGFYGGARDVTIRKLGENALQESESKYRSLFQHAPIGLAVSDRDGHLLDCNDAFLRQGGYTRSNIKDIKNTKEFYMNPNDRKKFLKEFSNSGKVDQWDVTLKRRDGSPYEAWLTVVPFVFEGKPCMMSLVEDVTERKLATAALKESQERLALVFDNTNEVINLIRYDPNGHHQVLAVNEAFLSMTGFEEAQVIGKSITELMPPDDLEYVGKQYMRAAKEKTPLEDLRKFMTTQGETWFETSVVPILDEEGEVTHLLTIARDVSERIEMEGVLRDSEERNKAMAENVQEAIFLFEPEKQSFIGFNQNAIQMFGYTEEEFMKMNPLDLSPPTQADGVPSAKAFITNLESVRRGDKPGFEWIHRTKEGKDFICEVHLTNLPFGERSVIMGSVLDISRRKEYETERENLIQELDRFVYSASHDLSAPLKSILGLVNLIRSESKSETIDVYLDNMERSIEKLENFIDDIIKYSRNSRLDVVNEEIELEQLVHEILDNLKYADGFGSIEFKTNFKRLPVIESDRFRLKIVLNNLISNSIKFRSTKYNTKPVIEINGVLKKGSPVIEVHDNGQGIDEEVKDRIFEMFFRGAVNSTGSGLGLYIAREAAENIDCRIQVESEVSQGSVFSLIFGANGNADAPKKSKKIRKAAVS